MAGVEENMLPESPVWEEGIYQLELIDPVEGGSGGIANRQATELANRTAYLKQLAEEIEGNVTNAIASMARQSIINGNLDIWQLGTSFTNPADDDYTADMFKVKIDADGGTPPTIMHTRQSLTPGDIINSFYNYRINPNGAGSSYGPDSYYILRQHIEHGTRYLAGAGEKVTLSFYAKSSIANKKLGVCLRQNYGTGGTPASEEDINGAAWTLTSEWVKYTHTFDLNTLAGKTFGSDNNDSLILDFLVQWGANKAALAGATGAESFVGSGNIEIAQIQLCAGETALDFRPKTYEEELGLCEKYFKIMGKYIAQRATGMTVNEIDFAMPIELRMRVTPGVTIQGTPNDTNGHWVHDFIGGNIITGWTFSATVHSSRVTVKATKTAHGGTDAVFATHLDDGLILDARF